MLTVASTVGIFGHDDGVCLNGGDKDLTVFSVPQTKIAHSSVISGTGTKATAGQLSPPREEVTEEGCQAK